MDLAEELNILFIFLFHLFFCLPLLFSPLPLKNLKLQNQEDMRVVGKEEFEKMSVKQEHIKLKETNDYF